MKIFGFFFAPVLDDYRIEYYDKVNDSMLRDIQMVGGVMLKAPTMLGAPSIEIKNKKKTKISIHIVNNLYDFCFSYAYNFDNANTSITFIGSSVTSFDEDGSVCAEHGYIHILAEVCIHFDFSSFCF